MKCMCLLVWKEGVFLDSRQIAALKVGLNGEFRVGYE